MNKFLEDLLKINPSDYDAISKHFLPYKEYVAYILQQIIPEIFGDLSLKEICNQCLVTPDDPDSNFVVLLDTESKENGSSTKQIMDLVTKIQLPKKFRSKDLDLNFFFILNLESQYKKPTDYPLEKRIIAYLADLVQNQSKYFGANTSKKFYNKLIPSCSIWILYEPDKEDESTVLRYSLNVDIGKFTEDNEFLYSSVADTSIIPYLSAYLVNVGPKTFKERKDVFGFLRTLIHPSDEIIEMMLNLNMNLEEEIKETMNIIEIREAISHERGIEEGREEGRKEGRIEGREITRFEMLENFIKDNLNNETIKKYLGDWATDERIQEIRSKLIQEN